MKNLFTITVLLLLAVAFSSKSFAQITAGTPMAPTEGQTITYVLNGMTPGDDYVYGVNTVEGDYANGSGEGTYWNLSSGSEVGGDQQGTATIEWLDGSAGTTFYVWIQINDSEDGCPTYRHLPVTPEEGTPIDEDYEVNYGILAMGTGDNNGIDNASEGTDVTACPAFYNADWSFSALDDATTQDGVSYVYFRIDRTALTLNVPITSVINTWTITPSVTEGSATDWGYASAPGQSFNSFAIGSSIDNIDGNIIYIRGRVTNETTSQALTINISGGDDDGEWDDDNITHDAADATLTVSPVAEVGTFSDSY
jgi:hypothetical protein